MKIYSIREYTDGASKEYIARIDARDVPSGVRRTGFQQGEPSSFKVPPGPFAANGIGPALAFTVAHTDKELPCEVLLEDLTKCKVRKIIGEWSVVDVDKVPDGVERTCPLNSGIFERDTVDRSYTRGERGPKAKWDILLYAAVRTSELVAAAQGGIFQTKITGVVDGMRFDGKTAAQCLELYVESMREGSASKVHSPLTPAQLAAAKAEWSAQLKAKTEAAKAEAKAEADALVGWNPYEGDDL